MYSYRAFRGLFCWKEGINLVFGEKKKIEHIYRKQRRRFSHLFGHVQTDTVWLCSKADELIGQTMWLRPFRCSILVWNLIEANEIIKHWIFLTYPQLKAPRRHRPVLDLNKNQPPYFIDRFNWSICTGIFNTLHPNTFTQGIDSNLPRYNCPLHLCILSTVILALIAYFVYAMPMK